MTMLCSLQRPRSQGNHHTPCVRAAQPRTKQLFAVAFFDGPETCSIRPAWEICVYVRIYLCLKPRGGLLMAFRNDVLHGRNSCARARERERERVACVSCRMCRGRCLGNVLVAQARRSKYAAARRVAWDVRRESVEVVAKGRSRENKGRDRGQSVGGVVGKLQTSG